MRKGSMPQNETREIADSDLDNISGGILGALAGGADSALPATPALPHLGGSVSGGLSGQIGPVSGQAGFATGAGI
ncbi:type A2 lantipeptide [Streptomyces platensis]|uniref:type A2 lantipeptide n=1 Tax=Streptomyces platensis TaxID=58346 RepID=UPI001F274F2E|nr:type A2 lantipeptide [Streptomyces platensis]MCF3146124.1 type A2 lantipeptide [Streptomyces platensis]